MSGELERFYKEVQVRQDGEVYRIALDRHLLRTPAKADLALPSAALAEALAEEWRAQEARIDPRRMPLMTLISTAFDNIAPNRAQIVAETADYGGHDLLCYWAGEDQPELLRRQRVTWQPILDWSEHDLRAPLSATQGVVSRAQPSTSLRALNDTVEAFDDLGLTALTLLTRATGSLILALAVARRRLTPAEAFEAALLDEIYQAELWGKDTEAAERRAGLKADMETAARFLDLLSQS
jgi:chaperone required for assembly of F1-ATPase